MKLKPYLSNLMMQVGVPGPGHLGEQELGGGGGQEVERPERQLREAERGEGEGRRALPRTSHQPVFVN